MYTKTNKEIYRFKVFQESEVEKEVDIEKEVDVEKEIEVEKTRKNKDTGEEEKYKDKEKRTVKEKQIVKEKRMETEKIEHVFVLKQPTRRQMEEADMEYSIEMSRCVKDGILTKAMLLNKYTDNGGIMSEEEAKELAKMYGQLAELQTTFTSYKLKTSDPKKFTSEQKQVFEDIANLRRTIASIETNYSALLNHTADVRAQNKVVLWYILSLTYTEDKGKLIPFFEGTEVLDKKESFYAMEEEEDNLLELIYDKLMAFVSFWYFSVNSSVEDFEGLEKDIEEGSF